MKKLTIIATVVTVAAVAFAGQENLGTFPGKLVNTATTPVNGTNEVQTLTIGGTPTGGTFKLTFDNSTTAAITWSATNATLLSNIQARLDALSTLGTNGAVATAGTLTAGIGTVVLTFSGSQVARKNVPVTTVANNSLTGTTPTLAVAETTPGVMADGRLEPKGRLCVALDTGILYQNTGSPPNPTWVKVSSE